MRIERIWVAGVFAVLILPGCNIQPKEPPPSTDIDDLAFRDHVRVLASDDFMGRKPGTAGEAKTVAYLVEGFRKLGLKPGNGTSYVQQVPLVQITPDAVPTMSVAGPKGARQLSYGQDMVIWTKRAIPQVQIAASEVVFVGYGIVAPEYAWDDYAKVDVHGKTVVVLANDPGYASKDPAVFRGNAMTDYGRWTYKVEEAARQGATGVLLVHDAAQMGYGWNVIQATWGGAQFEQAGADASARAAIEGWIQKATARALFTDAGLEFERLAVAAAHPGFKPVPLGLKLDAVLRNSIRAFSSANVIAWLPGRSGHEYVIYTAHWDSLGVDAERSGHNIFNGAAENATGVAGLLVLAQSFERTKPRSERSIVFLATTAAVPDLLGSRYYVENPIFPLRQTAAVVNVDTLLAGGRTRDLSIIGFGNSDLEDIARAEALLQGRVTHPEPDPQLGKYFRSDSYSFAGRGIPALYVQSGIDSAARGPEWGKAQIDDYLAHRYRQPSDQYSADWDVGGAVADLTLFYQVGLHLANSRRFPRWYADSEFRTSHHRANSTAGD
jgi:Zn-dependent M28 family amino/carboxypeptidase